MYCDRLGIVSRGRSCLRAHTPTIWRWGACDTARHPATRPAGACGTHGKARRGAGHGAGGTTRRGARVRSATRQLGLRYGQGPRPRHGQAAHDTARSAHAWARLCASGCAAGLQAVHLVHSACFWPGLTQYCS